MTKTDQKISFSSQDAINCLILMVLIGIFVLPTMTQSVLTDSLTYLAVAQKLVEEHQLYWMPHFLYPALVAAVKILFGIKYWRAGKLVHLFFYVILGPVIYFIVNASDKEKNIFKSSLLKILVPFGLSIVAPVFIPAFIDHHLYFGYIGVTVYHSATMATLRPFALMVFSIAVAFLQFKRPASYKLILVAFLLTVLATLAKPSFTIAFIPAFGILLCHFFFDKKRVDWKAIILGFFLPAALVLAWQFIFTYTGKDNFTASSIIFAPFLTFKLWSSSNWFFLKFLVSIFFPLGVLIVYFPSARKDIRLLLAWLTFLVGASYGYLLAETGRESAGNFWWSGQIGLFILFVYSTLFIFEQFRKGTNLQVQVKERGIGSAAKKNIVLSLFIFHVAAGIFWYLCHLGILGKFDNWW